LPFRGTAKRERREAILLVILAGFALALLIFVWRRMRMAERMRDRADLGFSDALAAFIGDRTRGEGDGDAARPSSRPAILQCKQCGADVAPRDVASVLCRSCGAPIELPPDFVGARLACGSATDGSPAGGAQVQNSLPVFRNTRLPAVAETRSRSACPAETPAAHLAVAARHRIS
jgi:hypothetical protein